MTYENLENVLILQGGGSLGAFGCGVIKALLQENISIDIAAGTSIGGINAAILAGSKDNDHPDKLLEEFWIELSENFRSLDYHPVVSFYHSVLFGNDKMFIPRWLSENAFRDSQYFIPMDWTYLYDHLPLAKTLEKYIDYNKLKPGSNSSTRLILTAVNVLTSEPLIFDSFNQEIKPKHLLATSAYPLYGFKWIEVEEGVYAWDGSLLSNTPLREVLDASPVKNKAIFLVENYPKNTNSLPKNLMEIHHRTRDIIFSDKTEHNVVMSKVITNYLKYIDELYRIIETKIDPSSLDKKQLQRIRRKYKKYKLEHGAEIKDIFYITRDEPCPHLYENADFSPHVIKNSIYDGERKTRQLIAEKKLNSN